MSQERLLVAEDDPPLRLVSLALGEPLDDSMRTALRRFFTEDVDTTLNRLRGLAETAGLNGQVEPVLANEGDLSQQLPGIQYLLVEASQITDAVLAGAPDLRLVQ